MIPKNSKKSREVAIAIALSGQLVFSVLLGLYIGSSLEEKYDWQPFGSLGGSMIGFVMGTVSFVRLHQITKK